jgi:BirA family biotin operon repressor/biotin-[acetyl-CoA-carboxylase] ligase
MDQNSLEHLLAGLPLGPLRYFASVGSTNDIAARWAKAGARHRALVVADEQTSGRGRLKRRWYTPPGSALAFSLVLRPEALPFDLAGGSAPGLLRLTALGALAVSETLNEVLPPMLPAQIKWPNDVIATRRKLAGVLVELQWEGSRLSAVVVGAGVNVAPASVPPAEQVSFPATCVEEVVDQPVDRWALLAAMLKKLLYWEERLPEEIFMHAWRGRLAFRGEWVHILTESGVEGAEPTQIEGQIAGLEEDGSLRLRLRSGQMASIQFGEVSLRPIDSPIK